MSGIGLRYAVNVSILFKEAPFLERFARVRAAGFGAVEFWWPAGEDLGAVRAAVRDADLTVALINFDAGDMPAGDRGLLGDPDRCGRFRDNVPRRPGVRADDGRDGGLVRLAPRAGPQGEERLMAGTVGFVGWGIIGKPMARKVSGA